MLPVGETLADSVYDDAATKEPVGEMDKAVVVGIVEIVSFSVFEVLGAKSCEP